MVCTQACCSFFSLRRIVTDADLDRVWSSVENGIRSMMEEESELGSDE
jgi:hypothetical protein